MGREWVWSLLIRALIPFMRAPPILHHELITSQSPHHQILSHSELDVNIWIFQGHKHSVQKTSNKFRSSLISGIVMKYISIFQLQDLSEIQLFYLISFQKYKYFIWSHMSSLIWEHLYSMLISSSYHLYDSCNYSALSRKDIYHL